SKYLGNGVDPMDVIDKYGADSLRYFLLTGSTPGQDLRFHWEKVESSWNFANKVWNASRFSLMNMEGFTYEDIDLTGEKSLADKWILTRLNETIDHVTQNTDKYEFGGAGRYLYNFIWNDLRDCYIEMATLPLYGDDESLDDKKAAIEMERLVAIIKSVRNIRAEVDTPMSKQIELFIQAENDAVVAELEEERNYIERFTNPSKLVIATEVNAPEEAMSSVVTGAELFLPLEGLIDFDKEIARLEKELEKWTKEVERVQKKLSNQGFVAKAPEAVVAAEKEKEKDYLDKQARVESRLQELKK